MSQETAIIGYLKRHKRGLTQLEALKNGMGLRLSARIYDLRNKGYSIGKRWKDTGNARVAQYYLEPKKSPTP